MCDRPLIMKTTMLIQGALQKQAEEQSQANTIDESFVDENFKTSKTNQALRLRSQRDKEIDLSGDTLVNYRFVHQYNFVT